MLENSPRNQPVMEDIADRFGACRLGLRLSSDPGIEGGEIGSPYPDIDDRARFDLRLFVPRSDGLKQAAGNFLKCGVGHEYIRRVLLISGRFNLLRASAHQLSQIW